MNASVPRAGLYVVALFLLYLGYAWFRAGLFWEPLKFEGPLIEGNKRAKSFLSCDDRPMGLSDVKHCIVAVEDHAGRKVDMRDIGEAINGYLTSVPQLAQWRPDADGNPRSGDAASTFPYTLHLLTISPIVILAVPLRPEDPWARFNGGLDGAIVVRALQTQGILPEYRYAPPIRLGSFIFSPDLKIARLDVSPKSERIDVPLAKSVLTLVADGAVWKVSRNAAP